ncbi:MAG: hypothetical protein Q8P53_02400 [Candidatus Shapirobacteria bacterium]|nr:hypothetical protein [Candidatus Shapirobacteria bacterium]
MINNFNLQNKKDTSALLEINDLIKKSLFIYKKNLFNILKFSLWGHIFYISGPDLIEIYGRPIVKLIGFNIWSTIIIYLLVFLLILIMYLYLSTYRIATILISKSNSNKIDFNEMLRMAHKRSLPYMFLSLLLIAINLGGFLLFVFPLAILSTWFYFAPYILIDQNTSILQAINISKKYVKSAFFSIFARIWTLPILNALVLFFFRQQHQPIFTVTSWLFQILYNPLILIYSFVLYKNVKQFFENNIEKEKVINSF